MEVSFIGGGNHQPVASHWQTLSHNVVSNTPRHKRPFYQYRYTSDQIIKYSKPGARFPTSYIMVFFMFNYLWWEVIVCFVDIGGIVAR